MWRMWDQQQYNIAREVTVLTWNRVTLVWKSAVIKSCLHDYVSFTWIVLLIHIRILYFYSIQQYNSFLRADVLLQANCINNFTEGSPYSFESPSASQKLFAFHENWKFVPHSLTTGPFPKPEEFSECSPTVFVQVSFYCIFESKL
jgi:hypothetical protein